MKPHPSRFWKRTSWQLVTVLLSALPCSARDPFDVLGASPTEVAEAFPLVSEELCRAGWAGVPIDGAHKQEWEAALRKVAARRVNAGGGTSVLQDFLENEDRFDETLKFAERSRFEGRALALRIRAGGGMDPAIIYNPSGHGQYGDSWRAVGHLDLARGRVAEADHVYSLLEISPSLSPELNAMFILRRLELPIRLDTLDQYLADESVPILHLARNSVMGRMTEVSRKLADPALKLKAREIALLLYVYGNDKVLLDRVAPALAVAETTDADRNALLRAVTDQSLRFRFWTGMPAGHAATAAMVSGFTNQPTPERRQEVLAAISPIIAKDPDSPALASMLAGVCRIPEDLPQLWKIAGMFRQLPDAPPFPPDPAWTAIHRLSTTAEPEELDRLFAESPSFRTLPACDRMRYLMVARLDRRVAETLPDCPFEEQRMDRISDDLSSYFRGESMLIPAPLQEIILRELPRIVMGSPEKSPDAIAGEGGEWAGFIEARLLDSKEKSRRINQLLAAAEQRDPAIRVALVRKLPASAWSHPGIEAEKPAEDPQGGFSRIPAWMDYIRLFSHPAPVVYPDPFGAERRRNNPSDICGGLLDDSPYRSAILSRRSYANLDPGKAAELRKMLDALPARTVIYDLLVSDGVIVCPDPDLRSQAEKRIAAAVANPSLDPFIRAAVFLRRLGNDAAETSTFLGDMRKLPRPIRNRLSQAASRMTATNPEHIARLLAVLKTDAPSPAPTTPPAAPQKNPRPEIREFRSPGGYSRDERIVTAPEYQAGLRLRRLIASGKASTPEAVKLTEELARYFCDSGSESPRDDERLAINLLVRSGTFDSTAGKIGALMKEAGLQERDVLRARLRLYRTRTPIAEEEISNIAGQIIALDPTDIPAAKSLLPSAVGAEDRPLVLKLLSALKGAPPAVFLQTLNGSQTASQDARQTRPLELFRGEHARSLSTMLLSSPLPATKASESSANSVKQGFLPLFLHTAAQDPGMLVPLVRWADSLRYAGNNAVIQLASRLKETGKPEAALELLALALFPEAPASGGPRFERMESAAFPAPGQLFIPTLRANGWLLPLAEQAKARKALDGRNRPALMIVMAAEPTIGTWREIAPAFFAELPAEAVNRGKQAVAKLIATEAPDARELLALLENETRGSRPVEKRPWYVVGADIRKATETGTPVDPLWKEYYATMKVREKRPLAIRDDLCPLTFAMATLAGDAAWKEYLDLVREAGISEGWLELADTDHVEIYPAARLLEFSRILLPKATPKDGNKLDRALKMFDRVASDPSLDAASLRIFKPWVDHPSRYLTEKGYPFRKRAFDLLDGDPGAVQPWIEMRPRDTEVRLAWTLAGHQSEEGEGILARHFAFLDGQFDLDLLAGSYRDKMLPFMTLPAAASAGEAIITPPPGTRFISMVARHRQTSLIRLANVVALEGTASKPFDISTGGDAVKMIRLKNQGPFFTDDAWEITLPAGKETTLADFALTGDSPPALSLWIAGQDTALKWVFRDANGNKLPETREAFKRPDRRSQLLWQRIQTAADLPAPPEAESAGLVFFTVPRRSGQGPITSRISGGRMTPTADAAAPFMTPMGRIPGTADSTAFDPIVNQLAIASARRGVGVFNLETKKFSGWIPLSTAKDQPEQVRDVLIGGNRLLVTTGKGTLHAISISTGAMTPPLNVVDGVTTPAMAPTLSPDGNLCAWAPGSGGLQIIALGDGGVVARRTLEAGGKRIFNLRFRQKPRILEATAGDGIHVLTLDAWERAPLEKLNPDPQDAWREQQRQQPQERPYTHGAANAYDKANRLQYFAGTGQVKLKMTEEDRTVHLPQGLLGLSRNGQPFYLTRSGRLYLLDSTKVDGFISAR